MGEGCQGGMFYYRVANDDMSGDHIMAGDIVLIGRVPETSQNEIMLVYLLGGNFILRRMKREKGQYLLIPSNSNIPTEAKRCYYVRVLGRVIEVKRSLA